MGIVITPPPVLPKDSAERERVLKRMRLRPLDRRETSYDPRPSFGGFLLGWLFGGLTS